MSSKFGAANISTPHSILCFGDSWTYGNYHALRDVLRQKGLTNVQIHLNNRWGSEAEYFASSSSLLPKAVSQTNADFVLLSMGGNDLKNVYFRKRLVQAPWTASTTIKGHLVTVLDSLYKEHPKVNVVMYGYDFLGGAEEYIFDHTSNGFMKTLYRWVAIPVSNYVASHLGSTLSAVEKHYQKQGFSFTYVPLWGTLQHVIEKEEEEDRDRGFSYWKHSAKELMQDPIHANERGYSVLMNKLYKRYFEKRLTS